MKRLFYLLILTLALVSCNADGRKFTVKGHVLGIDQSEFYVYSTDGIIDAVDTIHVQGGRFEYSVACESNGTLVIILPNYSEIPVFTQPGKTVDLKGSASSVKKISVKGTDENKLMNSFKEHVENMSPPETTSFAATFIKDNPQSLVSIYLLQHYFLQGQAPDYKKALASMKTLRKAQPKNGRLAKMEASVKNHATTIVGNKLPKFKAVNIKGDTITQKLFTKGDAIIYTWSTWEYESCNLQRSLKNINEQRKDTIYLLGICLDESAKECKKMIERDKINTPVVCQGGGFEGKLINTLGLSTIPDNIILKDGKVVARGLSITELREKFTDPAPKK